MHKSLSDHACRQQRYQVQPSVLRRTMLENRTGGVIRVGRNGTSEMFAKPQRQAGKHGRVKPGRQSATFKGSRPLFISTPCEARFLQEIKGGVRVLVVEDAAIDGRIQGAMFSNAKPDDLAYEAPEGEQ